MTGEGFEPRWSDATAPACVDFSPPAVGPLTSLGVGGCPRFLARPSTPQELEDVVRWGLLPGSPGFTVLGGMTNVLVSDALEQGLVIVANDELRVEELVDGDSGAESERHVALTVGAGRPLADLVRAAIEHDAVGVAALSGIPGTVGGAVVQNAGAYDYEVKDFVPVATVLRRDGGATSWADEDKRALDMTYRWSRLQMPGCTDIVWSLRVRFPCRPTVEVSRTWKRTLLEQLRTMGYAPGAQIPHAVHREAVLAVRRSWGTTPEAGSPAPRTVGSVFKNRARPLDAAEAPLRPVKAAELIDAAGFRRGHRFDPHGRVRLSEQHVLVLEAFDGAGATDVLQAAEVIRAEVARVHGLVLEPEAKLVGLEWSVI